MLAAHAIPVLVVDENICSPGPRISEGEQPRFAPQSVRFLSGQHVCVPRVLSPFVLVFTKRMRVLLGTADARGHGKQIEMIEFAHGSRPEIESQCLPRSLWPASKDSPLPPPSRKRARDDCQIYGSLMEKSTTRSGGSCLGVPAIKPLHVKVALNQERRRISQDMPCHIH